MDESGGRLSFYIELDSNDKWKNIKYALSVIDIRSMRKFCRIVFANWCD